MTKTFVKNLFVSAGILLILLSLGFAGYYGYQSHAPRSDTLVFADKDMLQELWSEYKRNNIEASSGRTLDKQAGDITTSEGQSYTMLRSVWMDDQATFDKSWQWTKDNLQRDDKVFAWRFGQTGGGSYGIQTQSGGQNTASDGDVDIALSLLMAYSRWRQDKYLYDAKPIVAAIWDKDVVIAGGKPVLAADDLEKAKNDAVLVNPSYFAPYAYKIFGKIDTRHDWDGLAANSYAVIQASVKAPLDKGSSANLPPDWILVNRQSGTISPADGDKITSNYGYDAFRTSWRMALDYAWTKDERAKQTLLSMSGLTDAWKKDNKLVAVYAHNGDKVADYEAPAAYGGSIGYYKIMDPATAERIYTQKLEKLYSPDKQRWAKDLSYYDDNWAWFGIALYLNALPDLTATNQ